MTWRERWHPLAGPAGVPADHLPKGGGVILPGAAPAAVDDRKEAARRRRAVLLAGKLDALEEVRRRVADNGDPCFDCKCCARYAGVLELMRACAEYHVAGEARLAPCHPSCLICSATSWQSST